MYKHYWLHLHLLACFHAVALPPTQTNRADITGKEAFDSGLTLSQLGRDQEAAEALWTAILKTNENQGEYDTRHALEAFMATYQRRKIPEQGLLRIGRQFKFQGLEREAMEYLTAVININPNLVEPYILLAGMQTLEPNIRLKHIISALQLDPEGYHTNFEVASQLWDLRAWESSLSYFERAFQLNSSCHASLSTSIYLRQYICKWGPRGTGHQFNSDLKAVTQLIQEELHMLADTPTDHIAAVTVHPHMTLGYHISPELKREVARSHSNAEKALVKQSIAPIYTHRPATYRASAGSPSFRLKVGYVSANIKSKTTVYMAQDLFRFHNRSRFEVHIYATTPPDSQYFIEHAMGGVDWRTKVRNTVEFFHDMSGVNVLQLANKIKADGIHILLNWDGYSNNGVRPAGLFPMQTAPIQIAHQEYIGTMGADFIQYMISDIVTTPVRLQHLYTEKFIYLPHCFLATSMPHLTPQITPPTIKRKPGSDPKALGCGGEPATFVFCNFNKHLKFSPQVFQDWLQVLQEVDGSVLCLLENPTDSVKNLRAFIDAYDSRLTSRVRFLPFIPSPFENQHRTRDMCHVVLDTPVYNGHTTAADALWGGVPIVVYGNGQDMGGRVGHSLLTTLDIPDLIARSQEEFVDIAIKLGNNESFFRRIRNRLIHTCYQSNPRNPLWDLATYVQNLETGFEKVWSNFLLGKKPRNIYVQPKRPTAVSKIYAEGYDAENEFQRHLSALPGDGIARSFTRTLPPLGDQPQVSFHDLTIGVMDVVGEIEKTVRRMSLPSGTPSTLIPPPVRAKDRVVLATPEELVLIEEKIRQSKRRERALKPPPRIVSERDEDSESDSLLESFPKKGEGWASQKKKKVVVADEQREGSESNNEGQCKSSKLQILTSRGGEALDQPA
jgi:protein O-GlcNAc transferase